MRDVVSFIALLVCGPAFLVGIVLLVMGPVPVGWALIAVFVLTYLVGVPWGAEKLASRD